ncbi:complex I subunit 4 family protein [Calidithermus roseus]|uniref:NADH-quinone oxidoreductase subunit 13 n=1 Tax=Calidithermus roseus TaxID=1644118 RepID=A0A399EUP5_9DEIN|nr:NADH-quinone oxidoreductase subunit M [Calidithermus roseus]RIH88337.1 NADH-quinone oxidoreductase subunit 13 [Calidithermus roseus]
MDALLHVGLFLPLLAGIALLIWPSLGRRLAVAASGVTFLIAAWLFARASGEAYTFQALLLEPIQMYYALRLDGVGLVLWLAVALTTLLAVFIAKVPTRMLGWALLMESGLLGIFAADDLILFYVFFEATLIPSLLMLGLYGGRERLKAAYTFALFTLAGSLPMLAALFAVRYLGGAPSFLYSDLAAHPVSGSVADWVFLGFLVAFAVKTPLFPLHAWLPSFHAENHPSGLADAMGTLYKVGLFAFFKWAIPLAPEGFAQFQGLLLVVAAFSAIYAAWLAFAAKDWKRLLAYGGVSHMGLGALGLFSGNAEGVTGALFLLAASMVYTGGLFLVVGRIAERTETLEIGPVRGIAKSAPALSVLTMFLVMAMIGLPGLSGFPGEFMALLGAWKISPWLTFIAFTAVIAAAAYALTAYQALFQEEQNRVVSDLTPREWAFAVAIVAGVVLAGVYPKMFTQMIHPLSEALAKLLGGGA